MKKEKPHLIQEPSEWNERHGDLFLTKVRLEGIDITKQTLCTPRKRKMESAFAHFYYIDNDTVMKTLYDRLDLQCRWEIGTDHPNGYVIAYNGAKLMLHWMLPQHTDTYPSYEVQMWCLESYDPAKNTLEAQKNLAALVYVGKLLLPVQSMAKEVQEQRIRRLSRTMPVFV